LTRLVGIKDRFYIGWKQSSANVLAVGLDKNTDSGDKIFFNINGAWEQNTNLTGSLMIRPIFGKGDGVITGLADEERLNNSAFFPNPSKGVFTVIGNVSDVQVFDLTGKRLQITTTETQNGSQVQLIDASPGLYVLRLLSVNGVSTHRIKVD
ncbi:MAG: T9SS type A sorting domain-containing protein, partial [Cyclobacteriaceae bacterium]